MNRANSSAPTERCSMRDEMNQSELKMLVGRAALGCQSR